MSEHREIKMLPTQYAANYRNFRTSPYEEIRREAFGEDIGQTSWLTADEHDRFWGWLDLATGRVLLDVACAREVIHFEKSALCEVSAS